MQVKSVHAASRIAMGHRRDRYLLKQLHREETPLKEQEFERIGKGKVIECHVLRHLA